MIAPPQLGSFVVNLGRLAKIPRGEGRVFQIGGTPIAVFHSKDGNVLATEPTGNNYRNPKTYPAAVNEAGEILLGIEKVLAAR